MSVVSENPDVAMSALAVAVRRLGGQISIKEADLQPFSMMSKVDGDTLHIVVMDYAPNTPEATQ